MSGWSPAICPRCKKQVCEVIDGEEMPLCGHCSDRLNEQHVDRQEFEDYHPTEGKS